MELLAFAVVDLIILGIGFFVISRRLERQYGARTFLDRVEREANTIITEINATAERSIRIIENGMKEFETLRTDGEKTVSDLRTEVSRIKVEIPLILANMPSMLTRPAPVAKRQPEVEQQPAVKPTTGRPGPRKRETKTIEREEAEPVVEPRELVGTLYRQGFSTAVIAKKTGLSLGEVDLIIRVEGGHP